MEIHQKRGIFNDGAFEALKDTQPAEEAVIRLEHGKPVVLGPQEHKAVSATTGPGT